MLTVTKKILSLLLIFFSISLCVFAQKADGDEKAADSDEEYEDYDDYDEEPEEVVWQTLEWQDKDSRYVTKYQIIIEKQDEKTDEYSSFQTVETKDNSTSINIEPQLPAGRFRYQIVSYDLFGLPSAESEWFPLVIYKAYTPKVSGIVTDASRSQTVFLEEYNDGIFNVTGQNLFNTPESDDDISFTTYAFKIGSNGKSRGGKSFVPEILEHDDGDKKLKVLLDPKKLEVGEYYFIAKDASGLLSEESDSNKITVKFKKRIDLDVSAGYQFPVILFDEAMTEYFSPRFWPLSATAKVTFIPVKFRWGFFGIQAQAGYSRIISVADSNAYTIGGNMFTGDLNLVYQKALYRRVSETQQKHFLTIEAHAGAGAAFLNDLRFTYENDAKSSSLNSINPNLDAGFAVQLYLTNRLYVEAQTDFVMTFMSDALMGNVVPSASVGWQF